MYKKLFKKEDVQVFKITGSQEISIDVNADEATIECYDANNAMIVMSRQRERVFQEKAIPFLPANSATLYPQTLNISAVGVCHFSKSHGQINIMSRTRLGTTLMDEGSNLTSTSLAPALDPNSIWVGIKETVRCKIDNPPSPSYAAYIILRTVEYVTR